MPKRRSIKISSPSDFEPKRKNPISLGSDSNIDNDLKPLTIGGIPTGLEISKDTIASNVENFVTLKEKTQELNVSTIKGNKIPSLEEPQIIFQNTNATDNSSGLWLNVFTDGTTFLKANDGQFAMAGTLMSFITGSSAGEDFLIKSGTFSSNTNILRVDNGGSIFLVESASAASDDAGYGQLWVKNDTPNNLYFTNDAGNDVQITNGSSLAGGGGASALNDLSDVTYSSGDLNISSLDKLIVGDFIIDSSGDITLDAGGLNINFAYNGDNLVLWDLQNDLNLKMKMPLNPDDYFEIDVTSNGATTIKTVDAIGAVGHMTIDPDGDLDLRGLICDIYPDTKIELKINDGVEGLQIINEEFQKLTASFDSSEDSYSQFRLYEAPIGTIVDYFQIQTEHSGKTTISTYDAAGSDAHLHVNVDGQLKLDTPPRIKEQASADSDTATYGQLWVKNDTPNNLYFTNDAGNDVQITNGSSLAGGGGGGGTDTWAWQWSTRWYTRYGHYYFPNATYGPNFYNWSSSSSVALTSWNDAYNPCIVVPKDMTFKSYHLYGNFSSAQTYVLCIKTGTPSYGSAGNTSLSTLGSEQTLVVGTANINQKIEETGLSVSLSAGDIIIPTLRRTTSTTSSSYFFCEGVLSFIGEYT